MLLLWGGFLLCGLIDGREMIFFVVSLYGAQSMMTIAGRSDIFVESKLDYHIDCGGRFVAGLEYDSFGMLGKGHFLATCKHFCSLEFVAGIRDKHRAVSVVEHMYVHLVAAVGGNTPFVGIDDTGAYPFYCGNVFIQSPMTRSVLTASSGRVPSGRGLMLSSRLASFPAVSTRSLMRLSGDFHARSAG